MQIKRIAVSAAIVAALGITGADKEAAAINALCSFFRHMHDSANQSEGE